MTFDARIVATIRREDFVVAICDKQPDGTEKWRLRLSKETKDKPARFIHYSSFDELSEAVTGSLASIKQEALIVVDRQDGRCAEEKVKEGYKIHGEYLRRVAKGLVYEPLPVTRYPKN